MTSTDTNPWAFASLLAGGALIVVGGFVGAFTMTMTGGMMGYGPMVGAPFFTTPAWLAGSAWWIGGIGVVAGAIVLYAADRLRRRPEAAASAGSLAIAAGAVSLLAMGGWIVGAVLAILGGALALGAPSAATRGVAR